VFHLFTAAVPVKMDNAIKLKDKSTPFGAEMKTNDVTK
jgi:hypothetical protein